MERISSSNLCHSLKNFKRQMFIEFIKNVYDVLYLIQTHSLFIFAGKHETDESPHGEKVWDLWLFCVRWFAANDYCCFFVTIVQSLRGLEVSCRDIGSTYRWCKHRTCSFPRPTLVSWRYISFLIDWFGYMIWELFGYNGFPKLFFIIVSGDQNKQRPSMFLVWNPSCLNTGLFNQ